MIRHERFANPYSLHSDYTVARSALHAAADSIKSPSSATPAKQYRVVFTSSCLVHIRNASYLVYIYIHSTAVARMQSNMLRRYNVGQMSHPGYVCRLCAQFLPHSLHGAISIAAAPDAVDDSHGTCASASLMHTAPAPHLPQAHSS